MNDPIPTSVRDPVLARAYVLIIGVGGLGAPVARTLATAGVGTLGLVDPDVVELSNLHRQLLYDEGDIGRPKVEVAAARLGALAPGIRVHAWRERFAPGTVHRLRGVDVVVDGTDTIAAKFLVNDAAVACGVPLVHAGVVGWQAQLLTVLPHRSPCYRCLFEDAPPDGDLPACTEAGVLAPVATVAGALQAAEVIRLLTGVPAAFAGRLLTIDARAGRWRTVPFDPNPRCTACAPAHAESPRSHVP